MFHYLIFITCQLYIFTYFSHWFFWCHRMTKKLSRKSSSLVLNKPVVVLIGIKVQLEKPTSINQLFIPVREVSQAGNALCQTRTKCFCACIAFGKTDFPSFSGAFPHVMLPRKLKLIAGCIQLKDLSFLCWLSICRPSVVQECATCAALLQRHFIRSSEDELSIIWGTHRHPKHMQSTITFKMFLQAKEKLHWENGDAKTARLSLGALHCTHEPPPLRAAYPLLNYQSGFKHGSHFPAWHLWNIIAVQKKKKTFTAATYH